MTEPMNQAATAKDLEQKNEAQETIENQRRKLRYRSWHRGTREMDLIMGRFADKYLADFTPAQLDEYEDLLKENDPDLYNWITGREDVPEASRSSVMDLLITQ